ncbi:MAG: ribE, partial [Planctomycetaceae bacterium]|nr:ribE [Planctomycetaceae bacterium]
MFTGLVEGQAIVQTVIPEGAAVRLLLEMPSEYTSEVRLGDSIALNGCCLTVIELDGNRCAFQAGTETLSKTNLGTFLPGTRVNVERALQVGARLGGHYVQG